MKKMHIFLMSFALISLLVGFSGCSNFDSTLSPAEDLTVEPVGEETVLSKSTSCVPVLASFFAPIDGLKSELEMIRAIAEGAGVPTGQVISNLAHQSGDVGACLGFLFGG